VKRKPSDTTALFVSSVFVKKPCRMQGLLLVMTLALLVYSVAQRRLRRA
jgi:transposase